VLAEATLFDLPAWAALLVLGVAGALASVVNAFAGGGSMLVLPLLIAMGLPPGLANGTNRVGVITQGLASVATFHRRGFRDYRLVARLLVPMMLGAAGGTWLATRMDDELLRLVFGATLAAWAVLLVVRPGRFLHAPPQPRQVGPLALVLSVVIGVYGGFLQVGVGFPLLALLVLYLGHPAVQANAVKLALTLGYTLVSLPMFAMAGQVAWREGLVLAAGGMVGGWLGTHWQIKGGANLVRWVVVIAVAASGVAMLVDAIG
jgi:uncharacterized membrane protein YfcA